MARNGGSRLLDYSFGIESKTLTAPDSLALLQFCLLETGYFLARSKTIITRGDFRGDNRPSRTRLFPLLFLF